MAKRAFVCEPSLVSPFTADEVVMAFRLVIWDPPNFPEEQVPGERTIILINQEDSESTIRNKVIAKVQEFFPDITVGNVVLIGL